MKYIDEIQEQAWLSCKRLDEINGHQISLKTFKSAGQQQLKYFLDYTDRNMSVLINNWNESATIMLNGDVTGEQLFVFKITEDVETYASMAVTNQLFLLPEFD